MIKMEYNLDYLVFGIDPEIGKRIIVKLINKLMTNILEFVNMRFIIFYTLSVIIIFIINTSMKLKKILVRYFPPGITLEYRRNSG